MKPPPRPSLGLVPLPEIRFFRRDRAGYLLVIIVPLIGFAALTWRAAARSCAASMS